MKDQVEVIRPSDMAVLAPKLVAPAPKLFCFCFFSSNGPTVQKKPLMSPE